MTIKSETTRVAIVCCWIGGALLAVGSLLLTAEEVLMTSSGANLGPWGANFVVLGTITSAYGFWILQPLLNVTVGVKVAGLLVAFGITCLILSVYSEPFLARAVAAAALISGIRGMSYHIGGLLPPLRYKGSMPLGELAAWVSGVAKVIIVVYLFSKSWALGTIVSAEYGAILGWTVLMVGGVLVVESLILRFMRKSGEAETLEDERDENIRGVASRVAHVLLIAMIMLLVVQFGLGGAIDRAGSANAAIGLSSPVGTAHVLLGLLFVSECGRRIAEIWLYSRARY